MNPLSKLHKDNRAIAFLIFYIIIALAVCGVLYMFLSDGLDFVIPISNTVSSNLGASSQNDDTDFVRDAMTFLFKYSPVWLVLIAILFVYSMAQKPERQW